MTRHTDSTTAIASQSSELHLASAHADAALNATDS
jgi:hypothetical protein